jgi:hypothetical protein
MVVNFSNHWDFGTQKKGQKNERKDSGSKHVYTRNKTTYLATNHSRKKKAKKNHEQSPPI